MKEQIKLYNDTVKIELASSGIAAILYIAIGLLLIFNSNQISEKLSKIGVSKESDIESET